MRPATTMSQPTKSVATSSQCLSERDHATQSGVSDLCLTVLLVDTSHGYGKMEEFTMLSCGDDALSGVQCQGPVLHLLARLWLPAPQ